MRFWSRAAPLIIVLCYSTTVASASITEKATTPQARPAVQFPSVEFAAIVVSKLGTVSSTFRSREHNRAVGGAPNSYHLVGRAIDVVRRAQVKHSDLHATLQAAGFNIIESLDEGDHSHFAFGDPNGAVVVSPGQARPVRQKVAETKRSEGLLADQVTGTLNVPAGILSARPPALGR